MKALVPLPNASENPKITHRTLTMPRHATDIIIMLSTLLARVMPP